MKTLHTYLTRQILASLLMTVGVFTFVLLLGNGLRQILPLLVGGQLSFGAVTEAAALLVPWVWVFALPMGMLTATLLIFGRFSADQELTATRASGVSLLALSTPILLLSLACCLLSALINMELGPRCRVAYTSMLTHFKAELSSEQLPADRFVREIPNFLFYVGKRQGTNLLDVLVFQLENETNVVKTVHAQRGHLEEERASQKLNLFLNDGTVISGAEGVMSFGEMCLDISTTKKQSSSVPIDDMTFTQLWDQLHELNRVDAPISRWAFKDKEQARATRRVFEERRKELSTRLLFQMHRQVAFSFACFGFTLIGIPLGIRVHRRETNIGIAIALALVTVYYSFILVAQALDRRPEFAPYLIVWAPNFLFQTIGAVLLWRANRGQ